MHNPNGSILSCLTNHLIDMYDDLDRVYPKNVEVRNGRIQIELAKTNPRLLITGWKEFLNDRYYDQILSGKVEFLNKDYVDELKLYNNGKK